VVYTDELMHHIFGSGQVIGADGQQRSAVEAWIEELPGPFQVDNGPLA
jgi:hypothetical protein